MDYRLLIKAARKRSGYSLRSAAEKLHISPSTLSRYESGFIKRIPHQIMKQMVELYGDAPETVQQENNYLHEYEPLMTAESRHEINADFLYEKYMSLDARGRRVILELLLEEGIQTTVERAKKLPRH